MNPDSILADKLLAAWKIPPLLQGRYFLRKAILLTAQDHTFTHCITKNLYPYIADLYVTKPAIVEKCIRTAVKAAWSDESSALHTVFDKRPKNRQLIQYASSIISDS